MRSGRSVLSLVLSVAAVSATLLAASRLAGRALAPRAGGAPGGAGPAAAGEAPSGGVQVSAGAADLSFYSTLGPSRPGAPAPLPATQGPLPVARAEPPPGGAYVVQALATHDGAAARRLRDRLAARGLPAVLVEDRAGSGAVFRVRVGRYRDREVAQSVARRLREEHRLSPWVLREDG